MKAIVGRDEPSILDHNVWYYIQVRSDDPGEFDHVIHWMTCAIAEYGGDVRKAEWDCWRGYLEYTVVVRFQVDHITQVDLSYLHKRFFREGIPA